MLQGISCAVIDLFRSYIEQMNYFALFFQSRSQKTYSHSISNLKFEIELSSQILETVLFKSFIKWYLNCYAR